MEDLSIGMWNGIIFLAGVVVSAIITAVVTRRWRRARPAVQILSINLGPKMPTEQELVDIDFSLIQRERASPILPALKQQMSVKDLQEFISKSNTALTAHRSILAHIEDLLAKPHILEASESKDQQRKSLLREWQAFGAEIEALGHAAIKHFESEVPAILKQPHPDAWQDVKRARVNLTENQAYNLAEIDVEAETERRLKQSKEDQSPEGLRGHLEAMNIMRRLWIHLEEEHVRWLFGKVIKLAQGLDEAASSLITDVEQTLRGESREYLRVEVLISNDGARNLIVHQYASLAAPIAEDEEEPYALIPMELEARENQAAFVDLVEGNDAKRLTYYSTVSTEDHLPIVSKNGSKTLMPGRLHGIFAAQTVACRFGCTIQPFGDKSANFMLSDRWMIGADVGVRLRKDLEQFVFQRIEQ
ncbi:hypothetical protein QWY74_00205 [Halomonas almeriensis]|uniref:hypothetical protein n=1 Tax=Halomonas almeriensis TaxID=308163 RepID=UPI0025B32A78|nr:hypothetical protein [Halomonas almeriensis]MDN3551903.1 hypothetical protein [Halomonas almeriensis]